MADMVSAVVDGGIVISRALQEPKVVAQQIMLFRTLVQLAFQPADNDAGRPVRAASA